MFRRKRNTIDTTQIGGIIKKPLLNELLRLITDSKYLYVLTFFKIKQKRSHYFKITLVCPMPKI